MPEPVFFRLRIVKT